MTKNPVAVIWLVGVAAAAAVYLLGSDWLLGGLESLADAAAMGLAAVMQQMSSLTSELLRAIATGLFVTFVGLSLLAIRVGQRGRAALVLVSAGFFWLVGTGGPLASREEWVEALLLAAAGALVMTQRLLRPAPRGARPARD